MRKRILLLVSLLTVAVLLGSASDRAHAEPKDGALAWGLLSTELSTAGIFALNFGVKGWPNKGPALALNMSPIVIGIGAGVAAHYADIDARPAYAIHGATALGFDMFLLGMLIDGRNESDGLKVGTAAWTLGTLGMAAGGWIGATQVDSGGDEALVFFVAPMGGFLVGGFVGTIVGLFKRGQPAFKGAVVGATTGLAIGLAASIVYAITHDGDDQQGTPRLTERSRAMRPLFSWAGMF